MSSLDFFENTATSGEIQNHLDRCSNMFHPPLKQYVDIKEYSKKIRRNALTVEVWSNNYLIGLVAVYVNQDKNKGAFITNISVEKEFQNQNLGKKLLSLTLEKVLLLKFEKISLKVNKQNTKAISFYRNFGFTAKECDDSTLLDDTSLVLIKHLK